MLMIAATVAMLTTLPTVAVPTAAGAVGTVLFQNAFNDKTVDGTGTVTVPTPANGTNVVCLTAAGNPATPPVISCPSATDPQGGGKLRLTNSTINQVGGVFGATSFPTSNGLDVTFNSYQWGGGSADGISFALVAVDPANPAAPSTLGPTGGSLGYSTSPGVNGITNAYLGVGLDVFGNFSAPMSTGTGCTNPPTITAQHAGSVVVRGPGTARAGYCGLTTSYDGTAGSKLVLRAATRPASVVPVQVLVNPTAGVFTSDSGVSVDAGTYKVVVKPVGQPTSTLTGPLPSVVANMYPSATWLNGSGVPKQLAFGFVGSTGSVTDVHEVSDVKVLTFNPVPQLAVATTSYVAATPLAGDPVNYLITPSVLTGANETTPISVSETVPAGVLALGAFGAGWSCQAPNGRTVTCTTTGSSFINNTSLPPVTVVAIVTASNMTATTVQTTSATRVSSGDANPATASTTTAGTVPTAPTGMALNPALGPIAGGTTVISSASSAVLPTAIEIGTLAEMQAGTPVVLLPCPSGRAVGCFTNEGASQAIVSMPARPTAAPVLVTIVTRGIAGASTFVYTDKPATPAAPTATAGVTSAVVTWVAPADNGGALTGYVVTAYLNGTALSPQSFDTSTTTRTFTGLTAGGSYAFTVAAVNQYGTSTTSAKSVAVIAFAVPNAPSITAVSAGTAAATLTWSTPSGNGSPITGYVVTPYIGAVAQTTQTFTASPTTQVVTGLTPGTAYTFTVAAQNAAGTGPASGRSTAVTPNVSPSLAFATPPNGEVGVAYSRPLSVTGGTAPFVWSVSAGTMPPGLSLAPSSGMLGGTPTTAGSFTFTVRVVDSSNQSATRAVSIEIAPAPTLTFSPAAGEVSIGYAQQPTLTGGTGPFTWAVTAGSLPTGLVLNTTTGAVTGTPTAAGSSSFVIAVTDGFAQTVSKTVAIVVVALPTLTFAPPASGQVGVAYSTPFDVTGGTLPLTWSISAGSVPAGLSLNPATGVLSGTPTSVGNPSFTVSVIDANSQTTSRATVVVIAAGPLVVTKIANTSSAVPGATVGYTVTITNTGATSFNGVTLSDPLSGVLDDAAYNADATASAGVVSFSSSTLGWTGSLAPSASVTISYSVTVTNPGTGNKVLANTVSSPTLGTNCAASSIDPRCTATVTVPRLTIVKTADVATTPGSTVHVTIVVTNTGQTPYPAATLTDNLTGLLDDAIYNADATAPTGSVSFTSPSVTWTGALAVGASTTITYSATIANPDQGDRLVGGTVVSSTAGSTCPASAPAPSCTATVTVLVPALVMATSTDVSSTTPGGTVAYTVTLTNSGQTAHAATTATLALGGALDDAVYNGDATASAGAVNFDSATGEVRWTGDIAVGAVVTVTASMTVRNPDPGNLALTTTTTSTAPGSTCPSGTTNPACTTLVPVRVPELTITHAAAAAATTPGSVVRYTTTMTNTGQTAYTGATVTVAMTGGLDDATYNNDAATAVGTLSFTTPTLTWTGNLAIGATATVTYTMTVHDPDTGDRDLTDVVTSTSPGSTCPVAGTDPRCATAVRVLVPAVTFVSTADVATATPGSIVQYRVVVTNTGETPYVGLAVTVDMTGALDDATYNDDATTSTGNLVTHPDGTVAWVLDLAVGASATGTMSVTVNDPAIGDRALHAVIVADAPGSTCPTGSLVAGCQSDVTVLVPGLTITKTADAATITPGGTVHYTVVLTNHGQTPYAAANLTDDLRTVLTDATYAADASATTGSVTFATPVLSWTGALAVGASATITYSVTVRDPDPGDKYMANTASSTSAGSNCPSGSTDPQCSVAVTVLVPRLTITTSANVATTTPGATVDYTVLVKNSGATGYTGATVAAALGGVLDDATYNADAAATSGTVTFSGSTLTWGGDLSVGASASITYTVTVHAADVGDDLLTTALTSTTTGNNCTAGGSDPRCASVIPVARLILAYGATDPTILPGGTVHFTATYTNTGQVPYTNISVQSDAADAVDDALPGGDQTASSGSLALGASGITWTGSIPVGGVVTLAATMLVKDPDTGDKAIHATTVSDAPGNNCPTGGTDPRCFVQVTVVVPQLTISKTANTPATVLGGSVAYTIVVHNTGETAYVGASITDSLVGVLDDASYNADATATRGTVTFSSPTLSWTGDLAIGDSATITYTTTAHSPATGDKTMVNPVSSTTLGSTCPPASGDPACRTTVAVLTPGLTIVKTADVANATLGSTVTYTVRVTDSGQTTYASAAISDALTAVEDDASYNGDVSATTGTAAYAAGVVSWTGSLTPGASATIVYSVTINNPASGSGSLANTVTSSNVGSNCPSGGTDTRCTATVGVTNAVSLTFTTAADVAATTAGAQVHYTVTVVNSTDADITAVELTDPLAGILDDASFDNNATASAGTVGFTSPDLSWTGTVPAHGTVTISYSVTVNATVTGDQILESTLSSPSVPASDNCLTGSTDPRCTTSTPIAALLIQQRYDETSTTPGSLIHLTGTFANTGQVPYFGITISSPSAGTIDDATPTGDQTASSGALVLSATAITWTGDIPVGATVTVSGTLTVQNPDLGDRRVTGTLASSALGNNCPAGGTDTRCTALLPVLIPGLTITKVASTTFVLPGMPAGYTITIHNSGETPYTGATVTDSLAGVLDDASYAADGTADRGTLVYAAPTFTWTGDLAVGATATITYSVLALDPGIGDKTLVNVVVSNAVGSNCPAASADPGCRSTIPEYTPALTITSAASAATTVPGATVTFTVTATNTGQTPYAGASLTVPLGGVLDDATYTGDGAATSGAVTITGGTLSWTGDLTYAASTTITYSVIVDGPRVGNDFRLDQSVSSPTQGSTCPAGGPDARCATSVPVAGLRIVNRADVSTATPTAVVRYTVSVTNIGQVPYVGVSVNDNFVGALDDAAYNGDAAASAGSLVLDPATAQVTWTGDLAVGASVDITGSVTVNNPDGGDQALHTTVSSPADANNCAATSTDPACTTAVTVLIPILTVAQVTSAATATPGASVGYTITITNNGPTDVVGATVHDSLSGVVGDATYNQDATTSRGSLTFTTPTLTWTGDLLIGQSAVVSFTVTVHSPDLGDKLLVNRVVSDELGSSCPPGGTDSACTSYVVVLIPVLAIAIVADAATTTPGSTVGYTLTVRNSGQTAYTDATVTTHLAAALDDAQLAGVPVATGGSITVSLPDVTWTGDIATGATVTITFGLVVAAPDVGNHLLTTTVSSPAPGSSCGTGPTCTASVAVLTPGLAVSLTAGVTTTTPGDRVTYTIAIVNTGQVPYPDATVAVALGGVLDDAVFSGPVDATSGVASYAAPTLSWTGALHTGDTATIRFTVTVANPATGDRAMVASVTADLPGSTCPTGTTDPACGATVTVLIPALTISLSADHVTTTPGAVVGYTVIITNTGETPYLGAVVSDSLSGVQPDASYNADAILVGGGSLSYADPTLTWTGDLAIGASATISYSITVQNPDPGDKDLVTTVNSSAAGSNCLPAGTDPACSNQVRVLVPGLALTKTADTATVVAGSTVMYTLTVTNTGETDYAPATFTDSLAGVLDDAAYGVDASATAGTVDVTNATLTWSGPLDLGATVTVTYTVAARFPATGDRSLKNAVRSVDPGSNCATGSDPQCLAIVALLVPALTVSKTADTVEVVAGGVVRYTVTAANGGESDYPVSTLTDAFSGVLDDAAYNGDATASTGAVTVADGVLHWTGPVPRNTTVTVTYSFTANIVDTGDAVLTNRIVAPSVGSTCTADAADVRCSTLTTVAARSITVTGVTSSFTLAGLPHTQVTRDGAVTMTVITNSAGGYTVTAQAQGPLLVPTTPGNTDTIPVEQLQVRESGTTTFHPLSAAGPVVVHSQSTASSSGGDAVSNDYRIDVPFIAPDTYSGTIDYIATAL